MLNMKVQQEQPAIPKHTAAAKAKGIWDTTNYDLVFTIFENEVTFLGGAKGWVGFLEENIEQEFHFWWIVCPLFCSTFYLVQLNRCKVTYNRYGWVNRMVSNGKLYWTMKTKGHRGSYGIRVLLYLCGYKQQAVVKAEYYFTRTRVIPHNIVEAAAY